MAHWWPFSLTFDLVEHGDGPAVLAFGLVGLGCGTSLGAIVEPGMDFTDVFLWPL